MKRVLANFSLALLLVCGLNYTAHPDKLTFRDLVLSYPGSLPLSPTAVAVSPDGKRLYLACETASQVAVYDIDAREIVRHIELPAPATGLALSKDGQTLYVTCAAPKSWVCVVATASGKVRARIGSGHTAMAPVLSPDGKLLYVCDRFNNAVQVLDLSSRKEIGRIPVDREPVAAALSPDGRFLFVANHIHSGRADTGVVAATVSVIGTAERRVLKHIRLTNGSTLLRGVCVSPDGRYVAVTHGLARFHLPTTTVAHGWMNDNALSLIDVTHLRLLATVLLDEDARGAANPWGVCWSSDGQRLCVTHAGTHEVSLINAPGLLAKLSALPSRPDSPAQQADELPDGSDQSVSRSAETRTSDVKPAAHPGAAQVVGDVPNDLGFLSGLRTRVKLRGKGPRCVAMSGSKIFVPHYFSDSLSILDLNCGTHSSATIQLEPPLEVTPARKGEMYFNDATLCYEGWQSCASCHSSDARVDGMNWDLLNDGLGNPKNVKSLLFCFQTPPVMSLGVRADAAAAIRAGLRSILFSQPRPEVASDIDEYVKNLAPLPSPFLFHNRPSASAERGRKLFLSKTVGCAQCHPRPLYTDLKPHAGDAGKFDQATDQFYTPTLAELWRTAPYLHDGSAATLRDVLAVHGRPARAGTGTNLTPAQVDDLVSFLLTL